jgi:hypothetical protein
MYVNCYVTKNKVQAGAVIVSLFKHVLVSSTSDNQNNGRLPIAKNATRVLKTLLVLRPDGWTVEELGLVSELWLGFLAIVVMDGAIPIEVSVLCVLRREENSRYRLLLVV